MTSPAGPRPSHRRRRHRRSSSLTGLTTVTALPATADDRPLPAGRTLTTYTVKPGDTATGLAVRFHAWTAG